MIPRLNCWLFKTHLPASLELTLMKSDYQSKNMSTKIVDIISLMCKLLQYMKAYYLGIFTKFAFAICKLDKQRSVMLLANPVTWQYPKQKFPPS